MTEENQGLKKEIPYMSKNDFIKSSSFNCENFESLWYKAIIKPSMKNRAVLISENADDAVGVFSRFDDIAGLEIIAGNLTLPENLRTIAERQLEVLKNKFLNPAILEDRIPLDLPNSRVDYKRSVVHPGVNPVTHDIRYHGGYGER